MGGGLLGFNRSKEVSKKLRNFIPRPYDGRGCHEVTGEGESQIAQQVRDDKLCHAELVSASHNETVFSRFTSHFSRKRVAFTLAEVLITLGIIGVVAALTIANLIQNYREKTTVTQVVKAYSTLSQAFEQAIEDNGTVDGWCTKDELYNDCSIKISNIMKPYLKFEKECIKGNYKCLGGKYKYLYSNNSVYFFNASNQYVLTDGSIVQFRAESGDAYTSRWCKATKNITKQPDRYFGSCGIVYVDVNGLKNPNTFDKDTFTFAIFKDGLALKGLPSDTIVTFNKYCLGKNINLAYGGHCSGWVVTNKNMDYLHCKDLSWSGKTKCK